MSSSYSQYGTTVLVPASGSAWAYAPPQPMDTDRVGLGEKLFLATLAVAGLLAYTLYQAGYLYVALWVVGVPFLVGCCVNPRVGLYAYCFWQAWDSAIVFGNVKQGAWLTPGKMFAFWVLGIGSLHLWRHRLRIEASRSVLGWACALCALALLSSIWSYDVLRSLRYGSQMLVQLLLAIVMVALIGGNPNHVKRLAFWTVLGGATAAVYVLLFGQEQHAFSRATLSESANPNAVAMALTVSLCCVPLLWCLIRSRLFKLSLIAASVVTLIGMVPTGSRAGLGSVFLALAGTAALARGRGRAKRMVLITVALVIAYVIGAMVVYSTLVPERTAVRLAEFMRLPHPKVRADIGGQLQTRAHAWTLAIKGYQASGPMGSGIATSAHASLQAVGEYRDVHSNVLGSMVELGPFGLMIFLGFNVAMALRVFRLREAWLQVPAWLMLLSTFAMGLTHTTYTTKYLWLPIAFLIVIYELDVGSEKHESSPEIFVPQGVSGRRYSRNVG